MLLSELKVGDKAEVEGLLAESAVRRRILDMGLVKGTRFKVLRVAPLGDPVEIFFKGMYLSLRKNEAAGVLVRKIGEARDGAPMGGARRRWRFGS
ncbi:iron transporter FeoA [Prosthecochloris sp. GSB1]|uniref:FeoA family protein n=1 Tax=Prosthecochloris sp. GSB1 TaxID=281093 RepID=UPI000B8CFAE2|nr:FeoA family protein [Prosthecochloris sp. GSB1]ASQ91450.1 iron transporter FeoA [Prosthecochloris sp. GSB1]